MEEEGGVEPCDGAEGLENKMKVGGHGGGGGGSGGGGA